MRILIIEDEQNNADRLMRLVHDIKPDAEIVAVLANNANVRDFFLNGNVVPDVILADIQLGDGLSFEGLKSAPQSVPVSEMSHVCIQDGIVSLYTTKKKSYILNITLDELEKQLDPQRFMRVNRQFIVSAAAVGISLINALTLSPALCALMLRPDTTDDKGVMHYLRKAYNITFSSLSKHYSNLVSRLLNRKVWVTCSVAQGGSSGSAIRAIQETAAKELPVGYSLEFGGITREESQTSNRVIFIFMICIVFVYLVMVALYESLLIPLVVILSVPFGLAGSLLFAKLFVVFQKKSLS